MKKSKSATRTTLVVICFIVGAVAYYAYLMNRTRQLQAEAQPSLVEQVLARDLEMDYPSTPREVLKYYNEIIRCFYNEDCTEKEAEQLGDQAMRLYDLELVIANDREEYLSRLKTQIGEFASKDRRISSFSLSSSVDVSYYEKDGYSFARIRCGYNIVEGKESQPSNVVYLLRQDAEGHWKIFGWDLAKNLEGNK